MSRACRLDRSNVYLDTLADTSAIWPASMRILFVADLHYALKQFDWLAANAPGFDMAVIGGDLLDRGSLLDIDVQIAVVEKYLGRLRERTRLLVSPGNHDCDARSTADESICKGLHDVKA